MTGAPSGRARAVVLGHWPPMDNSTALSWTSCGSTYTELWPRSAIATPAGPSSLPQVRSDEPMITARTDVVGSLLRPPCLLQAREDVAASRITQAAFKAIEDRAVDEAVALQEEAGLDVVTDGEMRRLSFQSQLPQAASLCGRVHLPARPDDPHAQGHPTQPQPMGQLLVGGAVRCSLSHARQL